MYKRSKAKKVLGVLLFLVVLAAGIAVTMLLWNAIIPSVIGWGLINYWQAAGLLILCRLLFGGFGKMGRHRFFGHRGRHHHGMYAEYHEKLREEMKGMSREERRNYIRDYMRRQHESAGHEHEGMCDGNHRD